MLQHPLPLTTALLLCATQVYCTPPCNGSADLCGKPLNEVTFPATHNANAAKEYGYSEFTANQAHSITQQLNDGVRAFLLDVMYYQGNTALCHGICDLGFTDHVDTLNEFEVFLKNNPNEIVVFLYQDSISMTDLEQDLIESGLLPMVYTWDPESPWPTLQQMITDNQRLVITTEHGTPPPEWVHHLWDVAWDTPYSFDTTEDFSCAHNRGDRENALFLVNHWLADEYGLPSQQEATIANTYETLYSRVMQCWNEAGQRPNFVAVDWYEQGDLIEVVRDLNQQVSP